MKKSIFIFRRDFRLNDNISFIECYKNSDKILPIFIFTPEQITSKNKYFSSNCFQFMLESLNSLDKVLKDKYNSQIHYYYGENIEVLSDLLKKYKYDSIYFNMDYTNYAQKRDLEINDFCKINNVQCFIKEDYLLNNIGTYLKTDGKEYQKYTPFKLNALKFTVKNPEYINYKNNKFDKISFKFKLSELTKLTNYSKNPQLALISNRENAVKILDNITQFKNYDLTRNILMQSTTNLSAYIKFGLVSIREVYYAFLNKLGKDNGLISQLLWREFYYYLIYYNPNILKGFSLKPQYDNIKWENNPIKFKAWCMGKTGFPIVDAGMKEMNETGYMHNRARLITSNILIKIINCDWRMGEKYFASKLIDYDPCVNNGNWQWSSGSGADSQPFFRIMSIERQTENFDSQCLYIKKWIPQLKNVPVKDIINWSEVYKKYPNIDYPKPIADYKSMRKEIIEIYKKGLYEK